MSDADHLVIEGASVRYGEREAVSGASIALAEGGIGCLLGPSGCGKSTLLRAIAGFEPLTGGRVSLGGRELSRPGYTVAPERRRIGMVFQDFALFPHLSVQDNVAFGIRDLERRAREHRVHDLLDLVGLVRLRRRYPHSLSGGEQQRVALARAMAPAPALLLLDEPFSSLDVDLRDDLVPKVRDVLVSERITAVLVTHDQREAFAMADRVGVMSEGRIQQWDGGYALYHEPATRFVADFVGRGEFIEATVGDDGDVLSALGRFRPSRPHARAAGEAVLLLVRPDDVRLDPQGPLTGRIASRTFRGSHFLYRVEFPGGERLLCLARSHENRRVGERVGFRLELDHLVMFPRDDRSR